MSDQQQGAQTPRTDSRQAETKPSAGLKERPDHCPEDVPRWYLYQQLRSVQRGQLATDLLIFTTWAAFGWSLTSTAGDVWVLCGVVGMAAAALKSAAAEKGSWAEKVAERLNVMTWHYPQEYSEAGESR